MHVIKFIAFVSLVFFFKAISTPTYSRIPNLF